MPARSHNPVQNQLLASLPSAELGRLQPSLELVSMPLGDVLYESGSQLSHVYFPTTSIVSLLFGASVTVFATGVVAMRHVPFSVPFGA